MTLFGALPPNRSQTITLYQSDASELAQLMEGISAGALIPEIVRRGYQDLLEAGVAAAIGAQRHEHEAALTSEPPIATATASEC